MRYVFFAFLAFGGLLVWMNNTGGGAEFKRHLFASSPSISDD